MKLNNLTRPHLLNLTNSIVSTDIYVLKIFFKCMEIVKFINNSQYSNHQNIFIQHLTILWRKIFMHHCKMNFKTKILICYEIMLH
jgi:hypothetical protein